MNEVWVDMMFRLKQMEKTGGLKSVCSTLYKTKLFSFRWNFTKLYWNCFYCRDVNLWVWPYLTGQSDLTCLRMTWWVDWAKFKQHWTSKQHLVFIAYLTASTLNFISNMKCSGPGPISKWLLNGELYSNPRTVIG